MEQTYTTKTIHHNGATIVVRRPNIDEVEREKRVKQIVDSLGYSLRDYLVRGHE